MLISGILKRVDESLLQNYQASLSFVPVENHSLHFAYLQVKIVRFSLANHIIKFYLRSTLPITVMSFLFFAIAFLFQHRFKSFKFSRQKT